MAETQHMTLKLKSIGYGEVGAASPTYKLLNGVIAGASISQEAPTLTNVEHEFTDNPLKIIPTLGAFKVTFDLGEFSPEQAAELTGGTVVANKLKLPATATIIEKEWKLEFYEGATSMIIHKGQVTANIDGADMKTNPLKLHIEITALTDGADFVDLDFTTPTVE